MTLKSGPKNFSMVFALAGDSTITKFFIQMLFVITIPQIKPAQAKAKQGHKPKSPTL